MPTRATTLTTHASRPGIFARGGLSRLGGWQFTWKATTMGKLAVAAGDKYGLLAVVEEVPGIARSNGDVRRMFRCQCECGNYIVVPLDYLRKKGTGPACGCRRGYNGNGRTTHGLSRVSSKHPLYVVWAGMIGRCEIPSAGGYENYGGRGIRVGDEWRNNPVAFVQWAMANGWKKGLHIDRKDNDGDYTPENCQFVTSRTNSRNTRANRHITFKGETLLLVEWSERLGISYDVLNQRINILKWTTDRALSEPVRSRRAPPCLE